MGKIWLLFVFMAVVIMGYLMFYNDEMKDSPVLPPANLYVPPQPELPQYQEVGDMSEEGDATARAVQFEEPAPV